jgi:DNA-binding NarL/FixJ family response regulator
MERTGNTKVMLWEKSAIMRQCLHDLLTCWNDEIAFEIINFDDMTHTIPDTALPDVFIMSIYFPYNNTYELIQNLKNRQPHIKILLLSMTDLKINKEEFGVDALISKQAGTNEIKKALRELVNQTHLESNKAGQF